MSELKFLVSACLAGVKCRYDGKDRKDEKVFQLVSKGKALPFCPEQLSGLPTPRDVSEISFNSGKMKVFSCYGEDLTQFFLRGAGLSFRLAKRFKISSAYLKGRSPSCGFVSGDKDITSNRAKTRKRKAGITSAFFVKKGLKIYPG
jgi:uncharacterized protein YbbK (DUF523 family)